MVGSAPATTDTDTMAVLSTQPTPLLAGVTTTAGDWC